MRVAGLQHDILWEDPDANFRRLAPQVAAAAAAGARLVVLTETYSTGFSMATDRTAEPVDGPSTRFLVDQAAKHGVWVCGSLPERTPDAELPFNRFILAGPAGELLRYAKVRPFTFAGERSHYAAGSGGLPTFDIDGVRVTTSVCYDLRFADLYWAAAENTDVYVVVANWPAARRTHWQALLRARAIENQAYVLGVNRVGEGGGLPYAGDSALIDPMGEVLGGAVGDETMLLGEVDPARVADVRGRFPFHADR
jgi:omega-amidase